MKLIIGNKNYSSWSLRPWLLLKEHQLAFEEIRVPLNQPDTQAQLAQYTQAGLVPVLHDNNIVIWDSLAICEYVSERYLDNRGWPADPTARALARACSAEMHSGFTAMRSALPLNCRASNRLVAMTPELKANINRIDQLFSQLRQTYNSSGPWLFGDFSIADCMFAPVVLRFRTYGVSLSTTGQDYLQWVTDNASIQQWLHDAAQEQEIIAGDEVGL